MKQGVTPDAILRQSVEEEAAEGDTRGKLKIFFGYAAGVGEPARHARGDYHAALKRGFDVVVGYVEPHAADTMALVDGLEQISPSTVQHRGISLREFDLDAVLARHPQIDARLECWPTRTPRSCRHRKRYQDVEELLRAGINVFTTVNVQHLEGLNDKIAAITHVSAGRAHSRPYLRPGCIGRARRYRARRSDRALEAGKIYLPDRARTALGNSSPWKNLAALREIALRRMADRLTRKAECTEAARGGRRGRAGVCNAQYGQRKAIGPLRIWRSPTMARSLRWWSSRRRARSSIPTSADDCAPTSIWPKSWVRT